jgi:hypothetical protein
VPFYVQRALSGTLVFYDTYGGFGVFANGTGTAQFDSFRVTQYPDPGLSLAPVIPRLGSSSVSWTPTTPLGTTATIKTSMDGLSWTDVTSQNGGNLPGLTVQPAPTIDLFTSDTSANYSNIVRPTASDTFLRANQSGFGTASDGESWSTTGSGTLSIASNEGVCVSTSSDTTTRLGSNTLADVDVRCRVAVNLSNDVCGVEGRYSVSAGNVTAYKLVWFTGTINLVKQVSGTNTIVNSASFVMTPGTFYQFHLRIQGATITGNIYADGSNEPAGWMVSTTDSSISSAGGFALLANTTGGSTGVQFDHFSVSSITSWTYDTANSRIVGVGSSALYLYSSISWADIDIMAVMDRSDAGGLVWRYVDNSNYYELAVYDDTASGGFTNQLRLYKVVAGTRSLIGSASVVSWPRSTAGTSPYKTIRVTMLGSSITVYFDGTVMQTATDSAFASGKMGLRNDGGTSRYYQLRLQPQGDYVSGVVPGDTVTGDYVYTQVTLATTDPSVTPSIQDLTTSALIPQLHDPSKPFAVPYNTEMDTLTSASGDFWWNVDSTGSLSFAARNAVPAPWALYSTDLLFTPNVAPTNGADLYRNRQNVTNCIDLVTVSNEQKIADGTATSWQMAYPLYSAPVIVVQSVAKTVGVQGVDSGKDLYWQSGSTSISQDSGATKIPDGYLLQFSYIGQFTRTVTENNLTEQAARAAVETGTTGIIEATEDGNGMLASNATVYADGLLAKHGNNNTCEFIGSTQRSGLAPGQLLSVFVSDHSLNNAQLLIVKVTTIGQQQLDGSVLYEYQIDATSGPNLSNFSNVFFGK